CPGHYRPDPAVADGDTDGMHNRAGAGIRHSLPAHGNFAAPPRNRDWENAAIPGRICLFDRGNHGSERVAFWSRVSSIAGAGGSLPSLPSLLARSRVADLGVLADANPGHSICRGLSAAGVRSLRRIRATRSVAKSGAFHFRAFSAHTFLPRLPARKHV